MDFIRHRSWMYNRINPDRRGVTDEFTRGVNEFVQYANIYQFPNQISH